MANDIYPHNCITLSIGNTDFQIIFSADYWFQQDIWSADMHFHLFCECHFLKKGLVLLKTPSQTLELRENIFCVLPTNLKHAFETLSSFSERISFYVVASKNKTDESDTFTTYNRIFSSDAPQIYEKLSERFDLILQLIQSEITSDFLFELKLKNLFSLILIELLESTGKIPSSSSKRANVGYEEEMKLKIESFIVDNFSPDARLDDLARYLCVSPRQTERAIKKIFNKSFQQIKTAQRMTAAKELITTSTHSLKTIAELVGYRSYNGFYKTFQIYTGLSPEEYKRKFHE